MSIMTKGLGAGVYGGGSVIPKGLQSVAFIPPTFVPSIERVELIGNPDLVKAHTPTSVYRIIIAWLRRFAYGY